MRTPRARPVDRRAVWDGATLWFATFVSAAVVAGVVGAGIFVRKARATTTSIREDAAERVFRFFCAECKKGIADGTEAWMTCEGCNRAVHEGCAMAHAASYVAITACRGSSSSGRERSVRRP